MEVTHPRALDDVGGRPPAAVDVHGEMAPVEDGTVAVPDDAEAWVRAFAARHGVDPEAIVAGEEADTCQAVTNDGEVCGRELPCQYHSDTDGAE